MIVTKALWRADSQVVWLGHLDVALISLMIVTIALADKQETRVGPSNATDRSQVCRKLAPTPASSDNHNHNHTHNHHQQQQRQQPSVLEWAQRKRRRHRADNSSASNELASEENSLKFGATTSLTTLASSAPETTRQLVEAKPVRFHHQMPEHPADGSKQLHDDRMAQDSQPTPMEKHSATSSLFHPEHSNSTQERFRRSAADVVAKTVAGPVLFNQQQIIHSMTGQTLVVPCRNYTLSTVPDAARRASAAGTTSRAASRAASPAPFQLTVPQIGGISLIVWHKDEQMNSPIFAADARGVSSVRDARQQVSSHSLRGRARLELVEPQTNRLLAPGSLEAGVQALPALVIEDAATHDAGLYTCTVEFHKAPTQAYQTRVAVIDPPKNMVIRDETNAGPASDARPIYSSLAGPFHEDAPLLLVCRADPGKPSVGQISWWRLDAVTALSADLLRSASSTRLKGPTAQTALPLLQPLNAKAKHLLTLNFDYDVEETGALEATTMVSLEGDIGSSDKVATDGPSPLMQSGDLFLGALASEFDLQQLVGQLPRALLGPDQRRRLLRHWRRVENKTIVPSSGAEAGAKLEAHLELAQLRRSNIADEYLCLASNEPQFGAPANASIRLNLNLKPLRVHIESKTNGSLRLGQKAMVECHALGSKPSAIIKWFKGGRELETAPSSSASQFASAPNASGAHDTLISEFNRDINNLTKISYLTFVPQAGDNQQELSCSAHNPRLPHAPTQSESSLLMNVQSAPRLALKFGASIRPDAIHLNSDIFMDCNIDANPPISELLWLHNGEPLAPNISAGVIMSNQSLVLRHVQSDQRGLYQCLAHNSLGQSLSNKLDLRPKFAPICDHSLTRPRYELALNQRARIECHVLAEPAEDLHFSWRFNNSAAGSGSGGSPEEALSSNNHEQLRHYETNFTRSSLSFAPRTRRDFGQLLCSATNSMGRQERACAIMLVQSELPEPLLGCFIDNQTHSSFSIHCQPPALSATGSSSRAGQTHFILELFANETLYQPQEAGTSALQDRRQRQQQLNLRQPESESRNLQAEESSMQDEDYSASSARGLDPVDEMSLERRRVKRLLSETPSFNVANLEPNSSYNVLVYVQNSRGRSPATHHQVSTRPMDASALASGRVELLAKRDESTVGGGGESFSDKMFNFLALGSHFRNADGSVSWMSSKRPLTSIALIVLLATLSLLTLVAFTNRLLCGRVKQATRVAPRACLVDPMTQEQSHLGGQASGFDARRKSCSSSELRGFVRGAVRERAIEGAAGKAVKPARPFVSSTSSHLTTTTTMSRVSESKQLANRQKAMQLATNTLNVNQHGCTGSGSETSRETNTDSTFISSPQTGTESSCQSVKRFCPIQQAQQVCNNYNSMQHQRRCSRDDLNNSLQATVYSSGSLQKVQQGHFQQPVAYSIVNKHPAVSGPTGRPNNRHSGQTDHSCWTSNSTDAHLDQSGSLRGLEQHQLAQPFGGATLMHDGIYVLNASHAPSHSPGCPAVSESEASSFWFGAGLQAEPLNRCQLVESETTELPLAVQPLHNSISIPISLSDRLQVINSRPNSMNARRLSQDSLPAAMLLDTNGQSYATHQQTGSYLTLAASFANQHSLGGADQLCETPLSIMDSSGCVDQQQQQQLELTPPIDFANNYRRFKQTFGIENGQQEIERQVQKHRVKFETGNEQHRMAREEM